MLKHPELPVLMAGKLKAKGYRFHLLMYGDSSNSAAHDVIYPKQKLEALIAVQGVSDCVQLMGNRPNSDVLDAMRKSSIFLFTSDKLEGWGAVANESLSNACVLVASDAIGSSSYLIEDGYNGFMFKNGSLESLTEKVEWLLNHKKEMTKMQRKAYERMNIVWSPKNAACSFMSIVESLKVGSVPHVLDGPCSKA